MKTILFMTTLLLATGAVAQMSSSTSTVTKTEPAMAMPDSTMTTQTTTTKMMKSNDGVTWENGMWMHGTNHATASQIKAHEKWMKANNMAMPQ